jgi:hypothetical protein
MPRYDDVARLFREQARAEGMELVSKPATPDEIAVAEDELSAPLPESFRRFQLEFGEFDHGPLTIYSVRAVEPPARNIVSINRDARTELYPRLPQYLIAFSDNGAGDYNCFDTRARVGDECPVVWWDHELDDEQPPELAAPTFLDWLQGELKEIAREAKGSRLDQIGYVAQHILREWLRGRKGEQ